MTDFGLTPEGFRRKTLQEILDEVRDDQRADISPRINTSPSSPHGQLNATFARQLAQGWEVLEADYDARDRSKAEGEALDSLGKLTGTKRRGASNSEVTVEVDLDSGTTLVAGTHFAEVDGSPDNRWTPKDDFTSPSDGTHEVVFEAEEAGPIEAAADTITVISTPVTGWNSVTNPLDASPGRAVDTDPVYRTRQEADVTRAGSASAKAIRADLLALEVDGDLPIVQCTVLENDTDVIDANGLKPHSIEAVVHDSPDVDNDLIAQTILDSKAAGIGTNGSLTGNAIGANGQTIVMRFSRPTEREIYITYDLTTETGYPGDASFKASVVSYLRGFHTLDQDVFRWRCELAANTVSGVVNAVVTLGFAASPVGTADLAISPRELATFDTTRIVVT